MTGFAKIMLISLAACLVMSTSPPLATVSGLVWGITLLLGGYWTGRTQMLIIFALNVLLLLGVAGDRVLFFLLIFGLPSLIMSLQLGNQKGYYDVQVRVHETFVAQMHLDTDDANAAGLRDGDKVQIILSERDCRICDTIRK